VLDLTQALSDLIDVVPASCRELAHVDPAKLIVGLTRGRKRSSDGLLAKLVPLVEPGDFDWGGPRYAVLFCWPRFMQLTYKRKLEIIIHELYHVGRDFDGSFREFPGRGKLHGNGCDYEAFCAELAARATPALERTGRTEFLRMNPRAAKARFGGLCGSFVRLNFSGNGGLCAQVKGPEPL